MNIFNVFYFFNDGLNIVVDFSSCFVNLDIIWEIIKGINVGIDVGFLKDCFMFFMNYYVNMMMGLFLDV